MRSLVKLTGQVFHAQLLIRMGVRKGFVDFIHLGFGENGLAAALEQFRGKILDIIDKEDPDLLQSLNAQKGTALLQKIAGLKIQGAAFLHINAIDHVTPPVRAVRYPGGSTCSQR